MELSGYSHKYVRSTSHKDSQRLLSLKHGDFGSEGSLETIRLLLKSAPYCYCTETLSQV
jgi:hypothetical protein